MSDGSTGNSFFGRNKNNDDNLKKAARVQDFVNKFKVPSRDLYNKDANSAMFDGDKQSYSWLRKSLNTANSREIRYKEYVEMCNVPELNQGLNIYCLHPDTIISTLKGNYTIKELADGKLGNEFELWSYNTKENKVDIGKAKDPHITLKNTDVYKVTFNNGSEIIATDNHPFLLKTGEYKELGKLIPGDRIVPFYSREKQERPLLSTMKYGSMGYHQYVYFLKTGERIKRPNVIHHKDGDKFNNSFDNLIVMTNEEHTRLHMKEDLRIKKLIEITQKKERNKKISKSWTDKRKKEFGNYIKELYKNSPKYKTRVARPGSLNGRWIDLDVDVYEESKKYRTLGDMANALNVDGQVIGRRINSLGFNGWMQLREHHCLNLMSSNIDKKLSNIVNSSPYSRPYFYDMMKKIGHNSWSDMQENYTNHEVISIEYYGKSDVYDMEVEEFHNFNANGVFVHNSDNATQYNIKNNVLEIESKNSQIVEILNNLFFENLDINASLWNIAKNMCKMGDEFVEIIPDNKANPNHILALKRIKKPESVERLEKNGQLQQFTYNKTIEDKTKIIEKTFQPWQIVHFRIDDDEWDPYGRSIFESGRKTFKRLALMEDAMLIYRISRAPERRVFYIDVGNVSTKDANHYIEKLKMKFRKKSFVNPQTGEIDRKANPLAIDEDFFIPVRQNSQGTRIETLPPGQNLGEIDDVKYFKDQILRTMSIPSAYLGGADQGGTFDSKSFLSQQDIQFARTIERIQKFIVKGLEKIAIEELIFNKIDKEELRKFKIKLTAPSNVDQLMEIEIRNQQFALIQNIKSVGGDLPFLPDEWIYENVLGMSERDINQIKLRNQMQIQMQGQMQQMFGGDAAAGGGMAGGNMAGPSGATTVGGPAETSSGPVGGGEEAITPGGPTGGADLEVAGQSVEFDGGKWMMENTKNVQKLLKYVQLYEKYNKDKLEVKEQYNSVTRMAIIGEFRGLITASQSSNSNKITLVESTKLKKLKNQQKETKSS